MRGPAALCLFILLAAGVAAAKDTKVSLSPTSLTFGNQAVGTTSAPQTATLTNTGNATVTITSITITGTNKGDFAETNTCGTTLAEGASCTISVTFTPTATGPRNGTLSVSDDASGSPQTVSLTGTGGGGHDPLGTATGTPVTCPPGGVAGNACYTLTISCPNVADITATLKVTTPSGSSVGTVIFGTGGGGNAWYDQLFTYGALAINTVVGAGFTAAQINFNGLSTGWLSGPGGPRHLACRYATAAQWIHDNILASGTALCATGNSGGAGAIGYALSHYGLGSIFAMVAPTSGPVFSRLDYGCICNQPDVTAPCSSTPLFMCYGANAQAFVDPAYGNTDCSSSEKTHNTQYAQMFFNDSVDSSDATFSYPATDVHIICGGQDIAGGAPALGLQWFNLITTKASFECVADAPHALPNVPDGATTIASDVINYCHLQ